MEAKRTVSWNLKDGSPISAEIIVERFATPDTQDWDGYTVKAQSRPIEHTAIVLNVNGKRMDVGMWQVGTVDDELASNVPGDAESARKVMALGGYAHVGRVVVYEEVYKKIQQAIKDATAEAEQDEKYRAAKGIADDEKAKREAAETKRTAELKATVIPQEAVAAYRKYHTADKAWENEDEGAWTLINTYQDALEAQCGIYPEEARRIMSEAVAEENYGIHD